MSSLRLTYRTADSKPKPADKQWLRLVQAEVMPALNLTPAAWELSKYPPGSDRSIRKKSRYVRFLHSPNGEIYVVKAAWRFGGFFRRPRRIVRYVATAHSAEVLGKLGLPVPKVYRAHEGTTLLPPRRYFWLAEEFVEGDPPDCADPQQVGEVMGLLAKLHDSSRASWGPIGEEDGKSAGEYFARGLKPRIEFWLKNSSSDWGVKPDAAAARTITDLLGREIDKWADSGHAKFRLCHGDVTPHNFIATPQGIRMIDLMTVGYGLASSEIIKATIAMIEEPGSDCAAAWESYFEQAGDARWEEFKATAGLGLALYGLREFSQGRALGIKQRAEPATLAEIVPWVRWMIEPQNDVWGGSPAQTDWGAIVRHLKGETRS